MNLNKFLAAALTCFSLLGTVSDVKADGMSVPLGLGTITAQMLAAGAAAGNLSTQLPHLTSNVEGQNLPGLDGTPWFIYHAPASSSDGANASLRVQRDATYSGGSSGGTVKTIWGLGTTSPTSLYYEWVITGELHNQTDGSMAAQNVAVNGTAFKQFLGGYTYTSGQVGATWGGNFVCNDQTGYVNPTYGCVGTEIDNYFNPGVGTDNNAQRVVLQLAYGSGTGSPALSTDHVGIGVLIGSANGSAVLDRAFKFSSGGSYGIGLDFSFGTFNTAPIFMAPGQKIVFDGTTSGTYNWAESDISGTMAWTYGGANRMTLDNTGSAVITNNLDVSGGHIATNGKILAAVGTQVMNTAANAGNNTWSQLTSKYPDLAGNGGSVFVWNYTNGGGETDLFVNGQGGSGGFNVYKVPNTSGTIIQLLGIDGSGNVTAPTSLITPLVNAASVNPSSGGLTLSTTTCNDVVLGVYAGTQWKDSCGLGGSFAPTVDNSYNIGDASFRVKTGYFVSLGASGTPVGMEYVVTRIASGSSPTNSGTCALNSWSGGNEAGAFRANGACSAGTIILTFTNNAPNGRFCDWLDMTTPANSIKESAYTSNTVTASPVTMSASDIILFKCTAF